MRRKFQRESIERQLKHIDGDRHIKLWTAALQLILYSRILYNAAKNRSPNKIPALSVLKPSLNIFVPNKFNDFDGEEFSEASNVFDQFWKHQYQVLFHTREIKDDGSERLYTHASTNGNGYAQQQKIQLMILSRAADPRGVLTDKVVRTGTDYARDADNLAQEITNRAKDPAVQIWLILEAIGGLEYSF
jgi:hypothetical protein